MQHNLMAPKEIIPNTAEEQECTFNVGELLTQKTFIQHKQNKHAVNEYGIRTKPQRKFVWNTHLLRQVTLANMKLFYH